MSNKLELTWFDKEKEINVEPRILLENYELGYEKHPDGLFDNYYYDNMLIHGDNLLALKALENKYTGKIKCIYIDPPYNISAAGVPFDDNIEHSLWLNLMRSRIQIMYKLLDSDGMLATQIDDENYAYLYMLISEIFGKNNLKTICVKMSEATGVKMASVNKAGSIAKIKEYIILAKKDGIKNLSMEMVPKGKWDNEYKTYCENISDEELANIKRIIEDEERTIEDINYVDECVKKINFVNMNDVAKRETGTNATDEWCYKNANRIVQIATLTGGARDLAINKKSEFGNDCPSAFSIVTAKKKMYIIKGSFNTETNLSRCKLLFADLYLSYNPGDMWSDIKTTGLDNEGGVDFKNSKKPERLIRRIIKLNTKPGDIVLDSFLGSGTTAAVAHKLNRRFIGIEMGEQAYTHCKKRLDLVIDGTEQGGISKEENWQGFGGYKFYEVAPTLITKDCFDEEIINKEYNADMLAAAVALHEGFTYNPDTNVFWKQSKANENSYLFVTTKHVAKSLIDAIKQSMNDDEFLIIACKSYDSDLGDIQNISIKKIPQMLLNKCEYGVDNYNLHIISPPSYEEAEEELDSE